MGLRSHLCSVNETIEIMLQQISTRLYNERSVRSFKTIHILPNLNLQNLAQVLRYVGTAVLVIAYLIVTIFCCVEEHPISSYLLMPIGVAFIIAAIAILPMLKKTNDNSL